ncbi:bacterial SH3 domain protein [Ruminiclostridium hungatei]|uniref:Bacterial SH3 domain protein n=1 Tax=Ruminiclostridium hungatei TaxID=48256 RepID=A0A1V4SQ87_RUMHU|nr:CAP domain-containing protein [Ruminiclostridium hungatei]OPX45431.1 bacterial SH3 domain protein [Ruminiclostridium hungatei]
MKRKRLFSIAAVLLTIVFTIVPVSTGRYMADASEAYQKVDSSSGVITANEVNLRNGPSTAFDIICKLKKNQKVTVMGKLGDWYAVYVGGSGNVGSVSSQYLKLDKAVSTANTKQAATQSKTGTAAAAKNSPASAGTAATVKAAQNTTAVKSSAELVKSISAEERTLFELVNNIRKEEGLAALQLDEELIKIARLKARDMKDNNYFSHTSKLYGTPFDMMKKYGVKFTAAGENIAGNQSGERVVKAWLKENSNNIYNGKFTYTGIGIVESPTYGKLFVQLFIKK